MSAAMKRRAHVEQSRNPRYLWLGEKAPADVRVLMAHARLMVISSRSEGGANVVSEALAAGLPMLASRVPGNLGLLGRDYPGYFDAGDTRGLANLLAKVESDPRYSRELERACARKAKSTSPALEKRSWRNLLREITKAAGPRITPRHSGNVFGSAVASAAISPVRARRNSIRSFFSSAVRPRGFICGSRKGFDSPPLL